MFLLLSLKNDVLLKLTFDHAMQMKEFRNDISD